MVAVSRFGCYIPNWYRKDIILPFASFYYPQVSYVKLYSECRERHPCSYSGSNTRVGTPNLQRMLEARSRSKVAHYSFQQGDGGYPCGQKCAGQSRYVLPRFLGW